jgi:hypothetical protein
MSAAVTAQLTGIGLKEDAPGVAMRRLATPGVDAPGVAGTASRHRSLPPPFRT